MYDIKFIYQVRKVIKIHIYVIFSLRIVVYSQKNARFEPKHVVAIVF